MLLLTEAFWLMDENWECSGVGAFEYTKHASIDLSVFEKKIDTQFVDEILHNTTSLTKELEHQDSRS